MEIAGFNALLLLAVAGAALFLYAASKNSIFKTQSRHAALFLAVGAILVGLGGYAITDGGEPVAAAAVTTPTTPSVAGAPVGCGDDLASTITILTVNTANLTGSQYIAPSVQIWQGDTYVKTITGTATAAGTSETGLTCGKDYKLVSLATSASMNSGVVEFTAEKTKTVTLELTKVPSLTFRAYDNTQKGLLYDNADAERALFEASGVTFMSVTNNETDMVLGVDESFDVTIEVRGSSTAVFGDQKLYIGVKYTLTEFQVPEINFNGVLPQVDSYPSKITADGYYNLYESSEMITGASTKSVGVKMEPKVSQNPSGDITVGFFSEGIYASVKAGAYGQGIVKDDSSSTYVHSVQSVIFDIS